jgi:polyisoprenoid-binding protein YceI
MSKTRMLPAAAALLALGSLIPAHAADSYKIDPVHSSVVFEVLHLGVSKFYGRFNDVSGGFVVDPANPAASSFEVVVKTDSVDTANAKRDQHLKSPDFFNAAQFPAITLKSKSLKKVADGKWQAVAELDLHGVKKDVTVDIEHVGTGTHPRGGQISGYHTLLKIKRSDFGMTFMPDGIGDDVAVIVSIEGGKN